VKQQDLTNGQWELPPSGKKIIRIPYIMHPENGHMIIGEQGQSAMEHAKNTLGMSTEEIWAADPEVGKQ
jgi:hypothetical protein